MSVAKIMRASLPFSVIFSGWLESPSANMRLPRGEGLHHLGAAARHDEARQADALLLEELLLRRHQVLAVDEGRDAVRGGDRLERLGPGRPTQDPEVRTMAPPPRPVNFMKSRRVERPVRAAAAMRVLLWETAGACYRPAARDCQRRIGPKDIDR